MRKCDNCGKVIPYGSSHIEVRVLGKFLGYELADLDFCSPECFEEFFTKTRWKLIQKEELLRKNEV